MLLYTNSKYLCPPLCEQLITLFSISKLPLIESGVNPIVLLFAFTTYQLNPAIQLNLLSI